MLKHKKLKCINTITNVFSINTLDAQSYLQNGRNLRFIFNSSYYSLYYN